MPRFFHVFILCLIVLSPAVAEENTTHKDEAPKADYQEAIEGQLVKTGTGTVAEIINPLTMTLKDGRILSLPALDIPDFAPTNPGPLASAAKEKLESYKGKDILIYQTPTADKGRSNRFGHILAYPVLQEGNIFIHQVLLEDGLARALPHASNPQLMFEMYAMENTARAAEKRLWQEYPVLKANEIENAERLAEGFAIVEGTIESTATVNNVIYYNFGKNWRSDFTVSTTPGVLRLFKTKGVDESPKQGETYRVRGWLRYYNGPYIEMTHPTQMEKNKQYR